MKKIIPKKVSRPALRGLKDAKKLLFKKKL
jgi:hypothetical protein